MKQEQRTNQTNGWKIAAIILIIVMILENIAFFSVYHLGKEMIAKEQSCAVDICKAGTADNYYTGYYYEKGRDVCYCYNGLDVVLTKSMNDWKG